MQKGGRRSVELSPNWRANVPPCDCIGGCELAALSVGGNEPGSSLFGLVRGVSRRSQQLVAGFGPSHTL